MAAHFVYTADVIEKIRTLRAAGKSIAEIAGVIGTTRGSVSGRMSQLGLTNKAKPQEAA
jgi:hypothetical protein